MKRYRAITRRQWERAAISTRHQAVSSGNRQTGKRTDGSRHTAKREHYIKVDPNISVSSPSTHSMNSPGLCPGQAGRLCGVPFRYSLGPIPCGPLQVVDEKSGLNAATVKIFEATDLIGFKASRISK